MHSHGEQKLPTAVQAVESKATSARVLGCFQFCSRAETETIGLEFVLWPLPPRSNPFVRDSGYTCAPRGS